LKKVSILLVFLVKCVKCNILGKHEIKTKHKIAFRFMLCSMFCFQKKSDSVCGDPHLRQRPNPQLPPEYSAMGLGNADFLEVQAAPQIDGIHLSGCCLPEFIG